MTDFKHLSCPVCHNPLIRHERALSCAQGHSFDIASKGYVHLLLSQDKHSKDPGDNKEMAQARKHFLDKGYYEPLAQALCHEIKQILSEGTQESSLVVDAGCGDGYYTHALHRSLTESRLDVQLYGMDISKEAIRLAAGRSKDIGFIVASLFKLPFLSQSTDILINTFAPACDSEFARILKKRGHLVTVIPGKHHLFELKSVLYEKPYENDEKEPDLPSFSKEKQVRVQHMIDIPSQEDLNDLVLMTPYYWKTPKEGLERLSRLSGLRTTIDFIISIHSRK